MNIFRFSSSRDQLLPSSRPGKKQSHKLKSPGSSYCEALSKNKLHQHSAHQNLLAQEMSKQKETKRRSPSIIARLMGLDVLPPHSSSHRQHNKSVESQQGRSGGATSYESLRRSSKGEQKFKDVFEVLDANKAESNSDLHHQGRVNAANLTQAEMAFIRHKFMEAKRLSTNEKLRHSKEFNDALDSNKDLLLKFLQQPDSLFTKHMHDLQSTPHKPPHYGQAQCVNSQRHMKSLKTQKVDRDLLRKSHRSPHRHGGGDGCPSLSHTRHGSYDTLDLPNVEQGKRSELQPTKIVVLKPNLGGRRFASPSSSSDEFRADRRLPCTINHGRQKSNEDIRLSRQNSRDSGDFYKIMSRQRKASCGNVMRYETSGFRGYAGDQSSSGSDSSASDSELVPVTSRTRTAFNRKNHHRSLPSKSTSSSVSREAKRRLSERWKLTHKYEQEIEISRSGTLAEMLATSDKETRPASFNGVGKRVESNAQFSELPEPVGISSRDGWKGSRSRSYSKSKTIMNQESTSGYTIVLPKELITRDGLAMGSSSHHGESHSFLSSKSSRHGSNKSRSSYNSSPEVNIGPSLTKFIYMNEGIHQKEKLLPSKTGCSFSVDANSDSEDSSASDDIKTAMSSETPDLSTVTSLTDPDISRMPTEDVNHSSVPEPQPRENSKEGDQRSPVSVLEAFDDDVSSSCECFESVSADLKGLRMQLQLLKLESAAYHEASMLVSSDEDTDQESSTIVDETLTSQDVREEDWKSLYLVDLLANSRLSESDHSTVMETPVDPSLFHDLEKKYSSLKTSTRLERRFLFDQISRDLIKILKQFSDPHPWVKPKRVCQKWDANKIQETLRDLVTRKEEKPRKYDVEEEEELQWLRLEDDIEIIGRDIEEMLTDELIAEFVVDAIF